MNSQNSEVPKSAYLSPGDGVDQRVKYLKYRHKT
jgi:hypothetical protein